MVEILLSRQRVRHDENGFLEPSTKRTLEVETAVRSISYKSQSYNQVTFNDDR